jgi:hypothetical protein
MEQKMHIHGASGASALIGSAVSPSPASGSFGPSVATPASPAASSSGKAAKTAGPGAPQFGSQTFGALLNAQAGQFSLTKG